MKTMAFTIIDQLILVAYGVAAPTPEEWGTFLTLIERQGIEGTIQLIATEGGGPTADQRRALDVLLAGRTVPTAVVSPSAGVRGTVTALSWCGSRVKAFTPSDLRDAISFLGIPNSRAEVIERELHALQRDLDEGGQRQGEHRQSALLRVQLSPEDLARIDALAASRGVSREEMLAVVIPGGLVAEEARKAAMPGTSGPQEGTR
jgi:hypothetical protein